MKSMGISGHRCRFSSWVSFVSTRGGGLEIMLGLVHQSHEASSNWRSPLNCVRISVCWAEQGALRRDIRQEGPLIWDGF